MVSQTPRLVDKYTSHRTRPMKVICLGQSRTGTMGLYAALNKLGYNTWHLIESFTKRPARDMPLLTEALDLKEERTSAFGPLKPYSSNAAAKPPAWGREEWDVILGDYDALADNPPASFVEELLEAYPEAKVILTMRDVDSWMRSMQKGPVHVHQWWTWPWVASWDSVTAQPWLKLSEAMNCPALFQDFDLNGPMRQAYLDHYDHVRKVVPSERLLEFDIREGWAPLCKFLDQPIPKEPYPHVNESKDFVKIHAIMWWMAVGKMAMKVGALAAVPWVAWIYWARYRR